MYMGPIVRAQTRKPVSPVVHTLVGLAVLIASAAVMLPWFGLFFAYATLALIGHAIWNAPRTIIQMIDYAGTVALGR